MPALIKRAKEPDSGPHQTSSVADIYVFPVSGRIDGDNSSGTILVEPSGFSSIKK